MAPKVKRLAGQGAQNIGAELVSRVPTGVTPFQNIQSPLLDGHAKGLIKAGGFGMQATQSIVAFSNKVQQDAFDAQTLIWQDALKTGGADRTANYRNPEHADAALGLRADVPWLDKEMTEFDSNVEKITKSQEYKDLSAENRNALNVQISAQRNGHRAKAMLWMEQQNVAAVQGARDNNVVTAVDAFSVDLATPASTMRGVAEAVITRYAKEGLSNAAVEGHVRAKMDEAMLANIENILQGADPDKLTAMQLVLDKGGTASVGGKVISISDNVRKDIRNKIALGKAGVVNRQRGDDLFKDHPNNEQAAMVELKKQTLNDADFKATKAQYQERQRMADAQKERELTARWEKAQTDASQGKDIDDARLQGFSIARQIVLRAQTLNAKMLQLQPSRHTVPLSKRAFNMKLAKELVQITAQQLVEDWLPKLGTADGEADKAVAKWNAARESVGLAAVKFNLAQKKYDKKQETADQKHAQVYFTKQLKHRVTQFTGKKNAVLTDIQAGMLQEVAEREFEERNSVKAMTQIEADKLLTDLTSSLLLDERGFDQHSQLSLMLGDRYDDDGDLLKGVTEISAAMRAVPARDRFEMLRWYLKQPGVKTVPDKPGLIDMTQLDAFVSLWGPNGSALVSNIPALALRMINASVLPTTTDQEKVDWYKSEMMKDTR